VRLKFRDLYAELERSKDPAGALDEFLGGMPSRKKPQ